MSGVGDGARRGSGALPSWHRPVRRAVGLVVVLLGCGGAALTGTSGALLAGFAALGVCAGRAWGRAPAPLGLSRWRGANATALAACGLAAVLGAPMLLVALGLVCWLQVHRAFCGPSADHEQVALLLTLLMVLLTSILTSVASLGPLYLLLAVLGPAALLLAWLEDEVAGAPDAHPGHPGGLGGLWALPLAALVLTGVFFVLLPRVQTGDRFGDQAGAALAGFDESVELGDLGAILDNPQPVLRARVTRGDGVEIPGPHYFRGIALDHFDGRRWSGSIGGQVRPGRVDLGGLEARDLIRQEITLEPISDDVLFLLGHPLAVRGDLPGLTVDTAGTWRAEPTGDPRTYQVVSLRDGAGARSSPARRRLAEHERAALRGGLWRDLPPGLDDRVLGLAAELAAQASEGATTVERARVVADHLRGNYAYTTIPDAGTARQPLEAFLFETRAGHCEFFATALAVLLRAQGLHARVVNGFLGGERNDLGDFVVVRQRDAHSWVEVWVDDEGPGRWVRLDATPAAESLQVAGPLQQVSDWFAHTWNQRVVEYDLDQQLAVGMRLVSALQGQSAAATPGSGLLGWVPGLAALVAALAAVGGGLRLMRGLVLPERRPRPVGAVARVWARARRLVVRRGWEVPAALPPVEAAQWLRSRAGEVAEPLEALAWLHYRARYGGETDASLIGDARAALRALRQLPRRRRSR